MVQAVAADELIQGKGHREGPGFPRLLLDDGQAVSLPVSDDIRQTEPHDIGNAKPQIGLQDQRRRHPLVWAAAGKALLHGVDDLTVLFCGQSDRLFVHVNASFMG